MVASRLSALRVREDISVVVGGRQADGQAILLQYDDIQQHNKWPTKYSHTYTQGQEGEDGFGGRAEAFNLLIWLRIQIVITTTYLYINAAWRKEDGPLKGVGPIYLRILLTSHILRYLTVTVYSSHLGGSQGGYMEHCVSACKNFRICFQEILTNKSCTFIPQPHFNIH